MKINKKETLVFVMIVIVAVASKIIQYNFLPDKYFYDSGTILNMVNHGFNGEGAGYAFTARTFGFLNILGLTTLLQWSIVLAVIFNIVIFIFMRKYIASSSKTELIYFIASIFLVNVYVFNISKEIIQFTIFLIIYCIYRNKKLSNTLKAILISIMFYIESLYFRTYYIIMSVFMILIYYLLNQGLKGKKLKPLNVIIKILVVFFIVLNIARIFMYDDYKELITVRYKITHNRTTSADAVTLIQNTINTNSTNLGLFMVNYVLNSIRMLFPLELLFKGVKYIPFVIYQIYITIQLIIGIKKLSKENIVLLSCMIAYLLGSFTFEPDFGSLVRHESTTFFIMANLIRLNRNTIMTDNSSNEKIVNIKINGERRVWRI